MKSLPLIIIVLFVVIILLTFTNGPREYIADYDDMDLHDYLHKQKDKLLKPPAPKRITTHLDE